MVWRGVNGLVALKVSSRAMMDDVTLLCSVVS